MKHFSGSTHIFVFLLIIFIFIIMFSFKFLIKDHHYNSLENNDIKTKVETEVKNNTVFNISPETVLRFETHYLDCGHIEVFETNPPENVLGTDIEGLLKNYPEWKLKNYSAHFVNMYKYEDGLCPKHYFLGIKDGYVTVFYKRPGKDAPIKEITDIKADLLRADDRSLLEEGIEIYGEEELMRIKEGLSN
ncbi:MAG TPA: hypothetical protein GXZ31_03420 [Thermoanaerobacterales bacterium]|nr:hypothetical protein [Thermoanaerobacterales bacterium]